ncbi:beta-1,3-galactosyl-O-glycosyl-glycoprotein beta-1,6-N-acetylglucosaminyltransferase-like [Elysia marginata]|uniref:Beta-1,3-galactosyl-O-glycosyl-glycoprotein beta-1,6-N-acetylglucosaminyltransferase-like n=1 Tax=Elysia marginata TaxID=1093978 RepID=A0AAV4FLN8_9GAST|nr:beta-1,3-galactosyl-O-glycosyl-glycoprotein beta-1,6-N-acetylglucosaminyltransferase-like [Elysia marginata]
MENWLKTTVRRRCGSFQFTRRGLHLYVLVCVFLSSSTLFVISLRLYNRFYLQKNFLLDDGDPASGDATFDQSHEILQYEGSELNFLLQRSQVVSSSEKRMLKGEVFKPVLTSSQLVLDYHRNTTFPRKIFDCKKLIQADAKEQVRFKSWINSRPNLLFSTLAEDAVPQMTSDCAAFKNIRLYKNATGTPEEREYPLAHVILVHKDFEHMERLVRALYRPQHSFCLYVDTKATESLKLAVASFAACFDNIHLAPRPHPIAYAHVSRLVADIDCMEELLRRNSSWKYLINYAATELPIRTNLETVQILRSLNGMNDIHETFKRRIVARFDKETSCIKAMRYLQQHLAGKQTAATTTSWMDSDPILTNILVQTIHPTHMHAVPLDHGRLINLNLFFLLERPSGGLCQREGAIFV